MGKRTVLGLLVNNRVENVPRVQRLLTEFGCNIKARLGLHEVDEKQCSTSGLILMELFGAEDAMNDLEKKLKEIRGTQVQKMVFET